MEMTVERLWQLLEAHQGETFYTAKGLPFRYTVRGGELFVDRRAKSITVSTVASALQAAQQLLAQGQPITGPKSWAATGPAICTRCFSALASSLPPTGSRST